MILEKKTIWCVTAHSLDDGHRIAVAYYTNREDAARHAQKMNPMEHALASQYDAWKGDDGKWYECKPREIHLDREIIRARAISKLTPEELEALKGTL